MYVASNMLHPVAREQCHNPFQAHSLLSCAFTTKESVAYNRYGLHLRT